MSYIADRLFGIIIDEKSCEKREFSDKIVSRYKIVGLKGLKVSDFTIVTLGLQKLDGKVSYTDIKSFTNKYLYVVEYKDGRYYSYYVNDKDCFVIPPIKRKNVLFVYDRKDTLIYSLNGSIFYMGYIGSIISGLPLNNIKAKIDVKSETIELVLDKGDKLPSNYFFHLTPMNNYRVKSLSDLDLHYLFEECGGGVSKHGSIYEVARVSSDTLIVPSDCKYLIIYSSFIDTLVLNASLEYIAFDAHLGGNLKTLYISKEASKSLIGQFMHYLIYGMDYMVSNSFFCSMEELWSNSDYIGMWDLCNEERSKNSVKKLLDGINVVVY